MMLKPSIIAITSLTFILFICIHKLIKSLYYFEEVTFPQQSNNTLNQAKSRFSEKKNILLVNSANGSIGGAEIYTINLYKKLFENSFGVNLLIVKNSALKKKLKELKIPFFAYNKFSIFKTYIQPGLYSAMLKICKELQIQIIHCNIHREVPYAKKVAQKLPVKVVLTRHISQILKTKYLENVDGIIAVSSQIKEYLEQKIKKQNLSKKILVDIIPAFFDDEKFKNFTPMENKNDFFKKNFDIKLNDLPILCTIAIFSENKNQSLLIKSAAKLIHEKNRPVQILFAGAGKDDELRQLAQNLKVNEYIHFLGFTDKIPEILHYSNIKILPSKKEALSISLLEAALMKKPLIGTNQTGMEDIIKDGQTGLLFENNNLESITKQIEKLLDNPELQKTLGENAYKFVKENFSSEIGLKKLTDFYQKILAT